MDVADWFRQDLARLEALLGGAGIPWTVAAGAAVYLYTGSRPPTDLDVLVRPEDLARVGDLLGAAPERAETTWGEAQKVAVGNTEVVGSLIVRLRGGVHPYELDEEMVARIQRVPFQELQVPVLAPEDVAALKLVLQRGPDQGKHDLEDVAALAARRPLDRRYLQERLQRMGAEGTGLLYP